MHLGWVRLKLGVEKYRSTIWHGFGLALGCTDEHQNALQGIDWDIPKVYAEFKKEGWSEKRVDWNLLAKRNGVQPVWSVLTERISVSNRA